MKTSHLVKTHVSSFTLLAAAILLTALRSSLLAASVWSGTDASNSVSTNWSDAGNWNGGVPTTTSAVLFTNNGTVATLGQVDNIVDGVDIVATLQYAQTANFHTTQINAGESLIVSNNGTGNLFVVGTGTDLGSSATLLDEMTGPGTFSVIATNTGALAFVQLGSGSSGSHMATLNLTNLANCNLKVGRFVVGGANANAAPGSNNLSGTVYLAATNNIRVNGSAPALDVGDASSNGGTSYLYLGQTNAIFADTITVARLKATATMAFNPSLIGANPVVSLNGNSATRVGTLAVADFSGQTSSSTSTVKGTMDLSGGIVNAMVGTCTVGRGQTTAGAGGCTGTLNLGAGTFNVNTLIAGYISTNTAAGNVSGTVILTSGTMVVNSNLYLGYNPGASATATGVLSLTNGTLYANVVSTTNSNSSSTINITTGTLVVTNTLGLPQAPIGTLNLASAALTVPAGNLTAKVNVTTLNLEDNGTVVNVSSLPTLFGYPTVLPLVTYGSSVGGATLNLGTLPGIYTGYLSNDLSSTWWVVITSGPSTAKADEWGGSVNNHWDTTTLNWTNKGVAVPYSEGDSVAFDDLGKTNTVNLVTNHAPLGLNITNNVLNYTFTGAGSLNGVVGLNKQGSATLTLAETGGDNFSGGVLVGGGTLVLDDANCAISGGANISNTASLQIGNNDTKGALPGGGGDDEGMLVFDRTDNLVLNTTLPGGGGLATLGSGGLVIGNVMSYLGPTIVGGGSLLLTNSGSLSNSISVVVSNATLDVTALAGQTTVLNMLTVTNATINVAISGLQPPLNVTTELNADGIVGVSNIINISALPIMASYPVTLPVIQTAGISLGAGNFNFILGSVPAGYAGYVAQSGNNVVVTFTNGPVGVRPMVLWSGADLVNLNTNWSDALNWILPGAPTRFDNVLFNETGSVGNSALGTLGGGQAELNNPTEIDSIVDTNFTVATLAFTNFGGTYHNIQIAAGSTLTITNSLQVGAVSTGNPTQQGYVTVLGAGATLSVVNSNQAVQIWAGDGASASTTTGVSGSQETLDLSALDNFNCTISQFAVGASVSNTINYASGVVYLAGTNNIMAGYQTTTTDSSDTLGNAAITVGDCLFNAGLPCYLYLGQLNTLTADTIVVGRQKTSGYLQFNPNLLNGAPYPSVRFQGYSANAVALFEVGGGSDNAGTTTLTADANLAGGWVSATISTLNIGIASTASTGSGTTTGSLEFDAGTITAGTVNLGLQTGSDASRNGIGSISVNANPIIGTNATLLVRGNVNLAVNVNSAASAGTLTVNGGTVMANNIVAGTANVNSTVTLENNGWLVVTNLMGTPAAPLATLNLDGGLLQLDINGNPLETNIVVTTVNTSGQTTLNIGAILNGLGVTIVPLISYTGSDPFSSLTLGTLPAGYAGVLVDNYANNRIDLSLTTTPGTLVWAGLVGSTVDGNWNFGDLDWRSAGAPAAYVDGEFVQFDDTASDGAINLATTVNPGGILVSNNALNYQISGPGSLNAAAGVVKAGAGMLTLAESGPDNFSGGIEVSGGAVNFARTNSLTVGGVISGSGSLAESGSGTLTLGAANTYSGGTFITNGTLQLAYATVGAGQPELAAGSGPITDNGVLAVTNAGGAPPNMWLTNAISGNGAINLAQNQEINFTGPGSMSGFTGTINIVAGTETTAKGDITGTNVNLNAAAIINVASGGSLWVANSGTVVPATIHVAGLGNGENFGALRVDTAAVYSGPVNLTANGSIGSQNGTSGTISGPISDGGAGYSVTKLGGATTILTGINTYGGGTIISNATLQIGNGLANGTLPGNVNVAGPGATLSFAPATNTTETYSGVISGPGSLLVNGYGGTAVVNGINTFTNGVTINAGALWITNAAALGAGPKVITIDNGTAGHPELHLNGVSGNILISANDSFLTSWIGGGGSQGPLINEAGNNEIDGNFSLTGGGGGTAFVVNGGTLKLAGALAPITTTRTLSFGGAGNGTVTGVISDNGTNQLTAVTVSGPGVWTFAAANTYVTNTVVTGGTLLVNGAVGAGGLTVQTNATLGGSGNVGGVTTVQAGGVIQGGDANNSNTLTLAALNLGNGSGAITSSRFTVAAGGKVAAATLNVSGTNLVEILDASLKVGTNTLFTYTGAIGGTNGFAGFQLGQLPSGVTAHLLNTGSAVDLAVTSVLTVNTNSPVLTNSLSGNTLTLAWPADHLGWRLEVQTNSLSAGLGANWFTWPNSTNVTTVPIPLSPANPTVFFRLVYP